ncbi:MAG: MATE family efflux transporter [Bacteroidales bacterium]|nr:MATE family efflux transporter [Bacteroidales bacterium]MCF8457378.1 MATE family efflux transporter [Bacteroidales bacterium]
MKQHISIKTKSFNSLISLYKDILESISGTEKDFTTGSLKKAVLLLSIPMVLEMIWESLFAIADIYFVSRLGAEAVAAVGITESLITIVYSLGIGLSMATTAMVSRRIGEKNPDKAARTAFQGIVVGVIASLFIAIPGILFAPELLKLMGASSHIVEELSGYTTIMLGGNVVIMLLFIINAVFRSAGDAAISMRVLMIANIINIILDPCLIFGIGPFPELGIEGAAIATTIGRGLAVVYQFFLLFSGKSKRIMLRKENCVPDFRLMKKLIKISMGGIGQILIATTSWIGLVRIIAVFGSEAVAGYTIGIRIIIFSILPSLGISNAASTLVGQNLGAKNPGRAEQSVWLTGKINMTLLGVIGFIFILIPEPFVLFFTDEASVIQSASMCLRIISIGFISYGFGMVLINSFNGAGDTTTPTLINVFCFWLLEIPLAYLLAIYFNIGEKGVFVSIVVAESIMTLSAFILFKRGKWKLKQV